MGDTVTSAAGAGEIYIPEISKPRKKRVSAIGGLKELINYLIQTTPKDLAPTSMPKGIPIERYRH
jgi:hypothetical protein